MALNQLPFWCHFCAVSPSFSGTSEKFLRFPSNSNRESDQYWRLIYAFARKCGLNDAAAQDTVQEVMMSVAEAMPEFRYDRSRGSFKSWLLQITRRRVIDQQRRRGMKVQRAEVPLDEEALPALAREPEMEALWETEWTTAASSSWTACGKR